MRISDVEKLVGVSKKNIRFYEEQGLLSPDREDGNGYRSYSDGDVARLKLIKLLRRLAVPIGEIRGLTEGRLTLSDCMERHRIYLDNELKNIEHMKTVCADIAAGQTTLSALDTDKYEEMIKTLEEGGARFVKIIDKDKRTGRKGAILSAAFFCLPIALIACCVIWATTVENDPMPIGVMVLFLAIISVFPVGILVSLRQRLKEIDKGEENEAFKY